MNASNPEPDPPNAPGNPTRFFKAIFDSTVAETMKRLPLICAGIVKDGTVNTDQTLQFYEWR